MNSFCRSRNCPSSDNVGNQVPALENRVRQPYDKPVLCLFCACSVPCLCPVRMYLVAMNNFPVDTNHKSLTLFFWLSSIALNQSTNCHKLQKKVLSLNFKAALFSSSHFNHFSTCDSIEALLYLSRICRGSAQISRFWTGAYQRPVPNTAESAVLLHHLRVDPI